MSSIFKPRLLHAKILLNHCISKLKKKSAKALALWTSFFEKSPLFYYSLFFLFGISLALTGQLIVTMITFLFFTLSYYFFRSYIKLVGSLLFFCTGALFANLHVITPTLDSLGTQGTAYFHPLSVKTQQDSILLTGTLKEFLDESGKCLARNIPCIITTKKFGSHLLPSPGSDWIIKGSLKKGNGSSWKLISQKYPFWNEIDLRFSLISLRNRLKLFVEKFVKNQISDEKSALFITGMITGSLSDQELTTSFQRFGLSHILAISGFHFSLLAFIATLFLKPFLKGKAFSIAMIICLTLYLAFLGYSPSILRAWTMISLGLAGSLIERRISPFNALGASLIITLLYDPCSIYHLGFILSFGITFSILVFSRPMKLLLDLWLPPRSFKSVKKMRFSDKIGFIGISNLKGMLALDLAVNVIAIPLTFASFGTFPIFSLFFNLFIPLCAGGVVFLFAVSTLVTPFFYPLGKLLFSLTSSLTSFIIHLPIDTPLSWNKQIQCTLQQEVAISLIFFICLIGIFLHEQTKKKEENSFFF